MSIVKRRDKLTFSMCFFLCLNVACDRNKENILLAEINDEEKLLENKKFQSLAFERKLKRKVLPLLLLLCRAEKQFKAKYRTKFTNNTHS